MNKLKSAVVAKVRIDELKMAKYNPRKDLKPSDKEYQKLKASIEEFGYVLFIVVNKDLTVIGGHQRIKVMKELGYTDIEVTQVDLDKTREKALNLALNRIDGVWDMDMLGDIIRGLDSDGFNLDIAGFTNHEIKSLGIDISTDFNDILSPQKQNTQTQSNEYNNSDDDFVPEDSPEYDESIADGIEMISCPHCGKEFPK